MAKEAKKGFFGGIIDTLVSVFTTPREEPDLNLGAGTLITQQTHLTNENLEETRKLVEQDPGNQNARDFFAFQLYCSEKFTEAKEHYEILMRASKPRVEHYYYLACTHFRLEERHMAIDLWTECVKRFPGKKLARKAQEKLQRLRIG